MVRVPHVGCQVGKNNGTVKAIEYFKCKKGHGVLVFPKKVTPVAAETFAGFGDDN